jgi:hypothetical protein
MLGAASQHESERTAERARAKSDELARKGQHPGGRPPFGYVATYLVNPVEADALRLMASRVLEGWSLLRIARHLDAIGVSTREGRPWHHSTVRAWEAVRAVLADPARKRTRAPHRYILTGLLRSTGDDLLVGRPTYHAEGGRAYATRSPAKVALSVDAPKLEGYVGDLVLAVSDTAVLPTGPEPVPTPGVLDGIEAELAELADLRGRNLISLAEWMAARTPLLERREAAAANGVRPVSSTRRLLSRPGALRSAWPGMGMLDKRDAIFDAVEHITVLPATRGRWTPIAERLDFTWRIGAGE